MGAIAKRLFDKYYSNANDLLASIINSIDKLDNKIEYVESHGSGKPGKDATVSVGTTTTGAAGTDASVTNSGTPSDAVLNFTIPRGADGAPGADGRDGTDGQDGASATVSVGTTTTGAAGTDASVTNSGTPSDAVLNFTIPRGTDGANGQDGAPGADGQAASVTVGTTTTGEPGTNASVTNSGTSSAAVLDFTIPRGQRGLAATIRVGNTTTGAPGSAASVTNSGSEMTAQFDFSIPRGGATWVSSSAPTTPNYTFQKSALSGPWASPEIGDIIFYSYYRYQIVEVGTTTVKATPRTSIRGGTGATGAAATISVGSVTTGAAGTSASVTNSGTSSAAVFDFVIPRGADGSTANLEWTFVDSFNATSKNISIGDCKELLFVAHVSNSAMKVSSVFPIAEITGSTWYKLGGAYRTSSTNSDVEMECVSVSGSGSSFSATFNMSAAYVNGGNVSSSSFVNVYKRG